MPILRFGVFEVDADSGELRKRGFRLRLREQPLRLLLTLIDHVSALSCSGLTMRRRTSGTRNSSSVCAAIQKRPRTSSSRGVPPPCLRQSIHFCRTSIWPVRITAEQYERRTEP